MTSDRESPEEPPDVDFELKERAMDEAPVGITISDSDAEDNPLIYTNGAFERLTGYSEAEVLGRNCRFLQGEESDPEAVAAMREAIDAGEPVTVELVNYRKGGEAFWNEVTIAPVRDGGDEITNFVGFQSDVTRRKEAELAVERERENLERLVDRVNGLMGDVTAALVRATSRGEVERALCERVAATDPYTAAWTGERDLRSDAVRPTAWAGSGPDLADVRVDLDADAPAARAVGTGSPQVVAEFDPADDPTAPTGARSMAAIPLAYRGAVHGVLAVYADRPGALDARERVVLEALARTAATAIDALESRRVLVADNVVEATFEVADDGLPIVEIARRAGCRLEYAGSISREDGSVLAFFTAEGAPSERVLEAAREFGVEASLLTEHDGAGLFEFASGGDSLVALVAEHGAETRSIVVGADGAEVGVTVPARTGVRTLFERLDERFPGTELSSYRERERPPQTRREFIADLEGRLTERQLTALRKAYVGGFYDHPRTITGDELADSMGISRATVHQHLRVAERKLVGVLFQEPDK